MPDKLFWMVIDNTPQEVALACAFSETDLNDPSNWVGMVTIPRTSLLLWLRKPPKPKPK